MGEHFIALEQTPEARCVWQFRCSCGWTLTYTGDDSMRDQIFAHLAEGSDAPL